MRDMNRRAVLAGTAALPALAIIPATALGAAADPIFAAIEKHRQAEAAYIAACDVTVAASQAGYPTPSILEMEDNVNLLGDKSHIELAKLAAMTPTTVAGCAALLRHVANHVTAYEQGNIFEDFRDVEEPAKTLLSRIAATLDRAVQS